LLAGRNYELEKSDTVREALVNETLITKLGIQNPVNAVGKDIRLGGDSWIKIVGVIKDFKTNSLRETIKPTLVLAKKKFYERTAIKIHSANLAATHAAIEASWNKFYPEYAMNGSFLDENIAQFYRQEEQLSLLYKIFAGLAIFISCLGLFGLAAYTAQIRTREIGVRKVLGASVTGIIKLLAVDFIKLVLVAILVAVPVSWFAMNKWLQDFAYKINIGWFVFVLAGFIAILIAVLTISFQSIKAAISNPIESLRTE
jgi:ABC-type antimicrobial peptide transport system permease subunit